MPPRQVYGKRSRAIYDPHAVFHDLARKSPAEVKIEAVVEELSELSLGCDGSKDDTRIGGTKVLQAVSNNINQFPGSCDGAGGQTRRRHKRKIVVEESESEDGENVDDKNLGTAVKETLREKGLQESNENRHNLCGDNDCASEGENIIVQHPDKRTLLEKTSNRRDRTEETALRQTSLSRKLPAPQNNYTKHCSELLQLSSHDMNQFSEWASQLSTHFTLTKIAEASFGEVYRLSLRERLSGFSSSDESVFKIIALRPPEGMLALDKRKRDVVLKKTADMSLPGDVANEVKLLQRMSTIPGFTNFRDVRVIQGRPPKEFVQAYNTFNALQISKKKEISHFPDPSKKVSYPDDQLWAVIEMQDAGIDLEQLVENSESTSMFFAWDAFWQVVLSLAKGEEGVEFEHRDLHLGNICVREPPATADRSAIDPKRKLNFTGIETTIIDYTISRCRMQDSSIAYHDLSLDSALFEGDSTEEYQYEIYRYMRGAVFSDNPYAEFSAAVASHSGDDDERSWKQYHPVTNLIWLHYVLYKLLQHVAWPSSIKAPTRKRREDHARWKRENDLEYVLLALQNLLDPGRLCEDNELRSVGDLVGLALREGWLDVDDVLGMGGQGECSDLSELGRMSKEEEQGIVAD